MPRLVPDNATITSPPLDLGEARDLRLLVVASPDGASVGHTVTPAEGGAVLTRGVRGPGHRFSGRQEILFDDPRMSSRGGHCRISKDSRLGTLLVEDLDSKNGVFVNAARLESAFLKPNDVLRVGDTLMVLCEHVDDRAFREPSLPDLLGHSKHIIDLRSEISRAASFTGTVLVTGETGTGKELVSRGLHDLSQRTGAFVGINCSAIPRDLFESELFGYVKGAHSVAHHPKEGLVASAEGGTLFLDEIGEMPLELQPKLLRVIEYREIIPLGATRPQPVDIKVIAATQVDLHDTVSSGSFRRDLLHRIAEHVIVIPPLTSRREDIVPLWHHFADGTTAGGEHGRMSDLFEALLVYDWPGNVRELKSVARRFVRQLGASERSTVRSLPPALISFYLRRKNPARSASSQDSGFTPAALPDRRDRPEKEVLVELLEAHKGNVSAIASAIDRRRQQIYRWLSDYDLDPRTFR